MDAEELLDTLRKAATGVPPSVRQALVTLANPALLRKAGRVLSGLPAEVDGLRPLRVTVRATGTVGPFEPLLRASLVGVGVLPDLTLGDYGGFELGLATAPTDGVDLLVCLLDDGFFRPDDWDPVDIDPLLAGLTARLAELRELVLASLGNGGAALVLHTVPMPARLRDAVLSLRTRARVCRAWHELNAGLLALAEQDGRITVVDLASELTELPARARDERLHSYADLPYTDGALLALARQVARVAAARSGLSRKVLAVDLDNTLWGGVVGEVGAAGVQLGGLYPGNCYLDVQRAVRQLRQQGIVLVLASKNDPAVADEALASHPEVLLRPEAFSVRAVNWSAKAANLRAAAERLNLAPQAFAFLDDSAFERGHVAAELPEVAVLPVQGDPAYLVRDLLRGGWFDVPELTGTDLARPQLYRARELRTDFATGFASSADYLHALRISVLARPVTAFEVTRVAQLSARTNQFNLTGERFDEGATAAMSGDPGYLVASFAVADRFGDEGIVGAAWIEHRGRVWWVRNLVLSCRVFGRGVELAMADWIVRRAGDAGATAVVGRYVPTRRNAVAADLWTRAGFLPAGEDGVFTVEPGTAPGCLPTWLNDATASLRTP